jgi:hypothetical protein
MGWYGAAERKDSKYHRRIDRQNNKWYANRLAKCIREENKRAQLQEMMQKNWWRKKEGQAIFNTITPAHLYRCSCFLCMSWDLAISLFGILLASCMYGYCLLCAILWSPLNGDLACIMLLALCLRGEISQFPPSMEVSLHVDLTANHPELQYIVYIFGRFCWIQQLIQDFTVCRIHVGIFTIFSRQKDATNVAFPKHGLWVSLLHPAFSSHHVIYALTNLESKST